MVLYSFYIFDRHTECIYSRRWTPARPTSSSSKPAAARPPSGASIASNNGDVVAAVRKGMSHSDDEKLVFGLVFSLRNLVTKLGGADDTFLSYRTGEYKLHYYETPTRMKFVMLTDTKVINLRQYLHQIWANLYVEYVVKNPLAPVEHPGGIGVANELFERGLEAFITAVLPV
ncbi:TRS23 Transport protein particle TRAPP complex subunit [Pyrenophora tritici-repentis]|uniref:Trafficking protein particle complex subunit n=2 Tax=Pyrenophora tritici-repentis TaxID=45151 RepID=A0A2W1G497_9PLEO|nr:trafficking protein particle complex 1 [Pyrenophora tritici-repentis Pt-1C-BFP]KAA8625227.1 Trafficking protein particle complex 1 [Pyrenophora tritici-repentis]EDU40063.1 trafficking protein particle complex 1 [Pyrenophora tritici-repentis Pt-1C-BFP]KAF7453629.1 Trafficking protein particle complex 1 [Pyrenophora tritici-repentis]KAF7576711.1 TRS23, Transport protein particle (TRAPP) complex subunit [Pyrenophora tritici-repentis]KAG9387392.1 Trafficking protein particle complex 1 [Pyrenoph